MYERVVERKHFFFQAFSSDPGDRVKRAFLKRPRLDHFYFTDRDPLNVYGSNCTYLLSKLRVRLQVSVTNNTNNQCIPDDIFNIRFNIFDIYPNFDIRSGCPTP